MTTLGLLTIGAFSILFMVALSIMIIYKHATSDMPVISHDYIMQNNSINSWF